jgi:formiminotetrahydrofolate cyclodeaminase
MVESAARLSGILARIVEVGNSTLLSDLTTALSLVDAASQGASAMVSINLRSMRDMTLVGELQARLEGALQQVEEYGRQAVDLAGRRV